MTDASGAVIAGAKVVAKNEATGLTWTAETNADGNYLFPVLPPGVYRVDATREGFQTYVITGLKLDVATKVTQNVRLKLGAVSQQVVVTGAAPVIQTGTMTVGQVINGTTVQDIPLNGRHIENLIDLVPGSVTPPVNGFLTAPLRGLGSFGANTAGNREDTVNFLVNGINLNDMVQNQTTFQPSISTVSEFKVLNSTLSPQYGHTSGSIMSVVTRSGSNQFQGELFEFIRNNAFDAKNFFDYQPAPSLPSSATTSALTSAGPSGGTRSFSFTASKASTSASRSPSIRPFLTSPIARPSPTRSPWPSFRSFPTPTWATQLLRGLSRAPAVPRRT